MSNYSSKKLPRIVDYVGDTVFLGVITANPELASVLTSHEFDFAQTNVIMGASRRGLDITKIKLCATGEYSDSQMSFIYGCFLDLNMSLEDVSKFLDPKLSKYQMDIIADGVKLGVDVSLYSDYRYNQAQMEVLLYCLTNRIDSRIVDLIRDRRFSAHSMKTLIYATIAFESALTYEQLQVVANPSFSEEKINLLISAYELECSIERVKNLADAYNEGQIDTILNAIKSGISEDKLTFILNPSLNNRQMRAITNAINSGVTLEQLKILANPKYCHIRMVAIAEAYLGNNPYIDWILNLDIPLEQAQRIVIGGNEGFSEEQMKYLTSEYIREAYAWFSAGLTIEQLKENIKKFDKFQLEQIRWGLANKTPYLHLYNDPKFEFAQMDEIVFGIQRGFTEEQLLLYADSRIPSDTMRMIIYDIADGVPSETIRKYVKFKKNGQFDSKAFNRRETVLRQEILKKLYD